VSVCVCVKKTTRWPVFDVVKGEVLSSLGPHGGRADLRFWTRIVARYVIDRTRGRRDRRFKRPENNKDFPKVIIDFL